jgi:thymidylate synthase
MNEIDKKYKELVEYVLENGEIKEDRTGTGTKSIFGYQMKFNMENGFPLQTTRKIHLKSLIHELLWFLESYDKEYDKFGNTNIKYLLDNGVTFWTEWPYEYYKQKTLEKYLENDVKKDGKTVKKLKILSQKDFENKIKTDDEFALMWGDLGPVYGKQWKNWGSYTEKVEIKNEFNHTKSKSKIVDHVGWQDVKIDGINQIKNAIEDLKDNPDSRRILVNSWNVSDIDDMLLPPCHLMYQFYSFKRPNEEKRRLSLQLYQRSADIGLGIPYNIASYSILLYMVAQVTDMIPHEFVHTIGDAHIYSNHTKQLNEVISRDSKSNPSLEINPNIKDIRDFRWDDIKIKNYDPHPNIKMEVAV